jgi:hypothetical protein
MDGAIALPLLYLADVRAAFQWPVARASQGRSGRFIVIQRRIRAHLHAISTPSAHGLHRAAAVMSSSQVVPRRDVDV